MGVIKYLPPRHEFFEFFVDLGRMSITKVFEHEPFLTTDLVFVFPERWMSVQEAHYFMWRLDQHPDVHGGKIENVDILTSSPHLISGCPRSSLRIITMGDLDEPHNWARRKADMEKEALWEKRK